MLKTIVFLNELEATGLQVIPLGPSNNLPSRGARGGVGEGYPLKAGVGGIPDRIVFYTP